MSNPNPDIALVQKHLHELGEHFDTVQIFVTRHSPAEAGGTESINLGVGNWYARYGYIRCWLSRQESIEHQIGKKSYLDDNNEVA